MSNAYRQLEKIFAKRATLGDCAAMLHWDMAAMMPEGGAEARAEQLAFLAGLSHDMLSDEKVKDLLDEAESEVDALETPWQKANLSEMRRAHTHATALDSDLVEALSLVGSKCERVWRQARKNSDFKSVAPALEALLSLTQTAAEAKSEKLGCSPYDALLDQYEPGGRIARIEPVFERLEAFLPQFLEGVMERQKSRPFQRPDGPFPLDLQKQLGETLMARLGFDFTHGRLDVSPHPFCGGIPEDVRLTTRYEEDDFTSSLMGILHETGHALYERQLPKDWRGQPVGTARGMSIHESQSLLVEMQVCRSEAFLSFALPLMKLAFKGAGEAWSLDNMTRLYQRVEPGFIRVDADEVTYPAHVILRTKLEKAMIAGDLAVQDLPGAWNGEMKRLLGLDVGDDAMGCLQDIHWYDGAFGYFPTYTLGAMSAAQIYQAADRALEDLNGDITKGDFSNLLGWLGDNIHAKASLLATDDLLKEATGETLNPEIFINHLEARYG